MKLLIESYIKKGPGWSILEVEVHILDDKGDLHG